ncbi:hypothetical protein CDD83_10224 [Cordyceps sp. RAO-2017]|nr:hypothetical protein CDD83_10224 [Cordyceps sp. RAO-2017]
MKKVSSRQPGVCRAKVLEAHPVVVLDAVGPEDESGQQFGEDAAEAEDIELGREVAVFDPVLRRPVGRRARPCRRLPRPRQLRAEAGQSQVGDFQHARALLVIGPYEMDSVCGLDVSVDTVFAVGTVHHLLRVLRHVQGLRIVDEAQAFPGRQLAALLRDPAHCISFLRWSVSRLVRFLSTPTTETRSGLLS